MTTLNDLGFSRNAVSEIIVSTFDVDGNPNAAPMGALVDEKGHLVMKVFNSTATLRNLQLNKSGVVNLTSEIDIFYKSAFKEINPDGKIPKEWFEKSENINAPKMLNADASIEFAITEFLPIDAQRTRVTCVVRSIQAKRILPKAYNRAFSATMEAIILSTRIKALSGDKSEKNHVRRLSEMISNCKDIIKRTAPQSRYAEIVEELQKMTELWTAQK